MSNQIVCITTPCSPVTVRTTVNGIVSDPGFGQRMQGVALVEVFNTLEDLNQGLKPSCTVSVPVEALPFITATNFGVTGTR